MRLVTSSLLVFACHSAACRPPGKNGGTGGSVSGPMALVNEPVVVGPALSRIGDDIGRAKAALAEAKNRGDQDKTWGTAEQLVNAAGNEIHKVLLHELDADEPLLNLRNKMHEHKAAYDRHNLSSPLLYDPAFRDRPQHERTMLMDAYRKTDDQMRRDMVELREAYRQRRAKVIEAVLGQYRPMGGELLDVPRHRATGRAGGTTSRQSVNQTLTFAQRMYPKNWLDKSNELSLAVTERTVTEYRNGVKVPKVVRSRVPLTFRSATSRAHYQEAKMLVTSRGFGNPTYDAKTKSNVSKVSEILLDGSPDTAVHELWHRMEHVHPEIAALEMRFLDRRSGGDRRMAPIPGHPLREVHLPHAQLFHPYAAKLYPVAKYTEVGSMGWEYFVTGKTYEGRGPDADHVATVIGMMVTV